MAERVSRLEEAIEDAIKTAPPLLRELVAGLQALRGIAKLSAMTIAVEVGNFSRRGKITKTGNSHLRRVLIEAAWSYRHRPGKGRALKNRQKELPAHLTE